MGIFLDLVATTLRLVISADIVATDKRPNYAEIAGQGNTLTTASTVETSTASTMPKVGLLI